MSDSNTRLFPIHDFQNYDLLFDSCWNLDILQSSCQSSAYLFSSCWSQNTLGKLLSEFQPHSLSPVKNHPNCSHPITYSLFLVAFPLPYDLKLVIAYSCTLSHSSSIQATT